ncbi:hypothetical protein RYX36_020474 [Vicia faba]
MKMSVSTFTHLSYSSPSISSIFHSLPSTLISNPSPSKLATSSPYPLKKIKALGIHQTSSTSHGSKLDAVKSRILLQMFQRAMTMEPLTTIFRQQSDMNDFTLENLQDRKKSSKWVAAFLFGLTISIISPDVSYASSSVKINEMYQVGELFDLGIQLIYLLLLLGLLGAGTYYVIRQVLVRRELDLSAKELQEQVRSGDANATELFELGAVMLRRKFYPAATKFLLQAIDKWDGENQDLAQVYNALGVSYVRDGKLEKGVAQFETAVKIQPGYVTAWNNLGDALESKKEYVSALKAFEEVLLFDPNNKIARPRRDALKGLVGMSEGVTIRYREKK